MADSDPKKSPLDDLPERFSEPTPIAPDEATWRAMSPAQREAKVWEIIDALPFSELMSEGTPHSDAKMGVVESLRRFYGQRRRGVFIAPELTVMYPGEHTFVPDVLVVCDTELKHRNAWIVLDEGRGPDLILEIRNKGRRAKDYRLNVDRFARLGIREYFIYEVIRQELAGFHLESEESRRYVPILPQGGRYRSSVLDLDLAVLDEKLRFYFCGAELPDAAAEVALLTRMIDERSARLEVAESDRAQAETERADAALAALRTAIRAVLAGRGLTLSEPMSARLEATADPDDLSRLLVRATTLTNAAALFEP